MRSDGSYALDPGFIESKPVVWEYTYFTWDLVRSEGISLTDALDALGVEGWELVTMSPATKKSYAVFYFKRQKV